jgi:hypothetical protein
MGKKHFSGEQIAFALRLADFGAAVLDIVAGREASTE